MEENEMQPLINSQQPIANEQQPVGAPAEQKSEEDPAVTARKKRVKVAFIAAGSLLFLLAIVSVVTSGSRRTVVEPNPLPTPAELVPPLTKPGEEPVMADLSQTYQNGRLEIVIQYPKLLNLVAETRGVNTNFGSADEMRWSDKTKEEYVVGLSVVSLKIQVINEPKNLDGSTFTESSLNSVFEGSPETITDFTRDGRKGKKKLSVIAHEKTGAPEGGMVEYYLMDEGRLIYINGTTNDDGALTLTEMDQVLASFHFFENASAKQIECEEPRPEFCTEECLVGPPNLCGSDGKSYCSTCQACANSLVQWYVFQDEMCDNELTNIDL